MTSFSQRNGFKPIRSTIQLESIDNPLRNFLWNALQLFYWEEMTVWVDENNGYKKLLLTAIWTDYYEARLDEMPNQSQVLIDKIKKDFLKSAWNEIYDLIEFISNNYKEEEFRGGYDNEVNKKFHEHVNNGLKIHLSAYRFVAGYIVQITSEAEVSSIEDAINSLYSLSYVQIHLKRSLELLSDRRLPDYRNSIKESISAVESIAKLISSNAKDSLAASLDKIKGKIKIHPALEKGFKQIYGYTSDGDGIRHALTDDSSVDFEDAKFMLVSCSAFINYLIIKAQKAKIELK